MEGYSLRTFDEIDDEGQNDALVNLSTMWRRR
jgi:hypothetical protein